MSPTCPSCAKPASGRFCSHCGARLESAECRECGNPIPAGGRFCNQCGTPVAEARQQSAPPAERSRTPWIIAGVAVVLLLGVPLVLLPWLRPSGSEVRTGSVAAAAPGDPRAIDVASMDPREAADRLFNRVMEAASRGDTAQARMFLPMALAAYERVPDRDLDARYHVAVLHMLDGNPQAALSQADSILTAEPSHLFGLFTVGEAKRALGAEQEARRYFRRFLESYDREVARQLPEYRDHAAVLPVLREQAREAVQ